MLSILRKTTASLAKNDRSTSSAEQYHVFGDELSAWEFVNATISDDDGEDVYSFDGDDAISDEVDAKTEEVEDTCESHNLGPPDDVMSLRSLSVSPPMAFPVEVIRHHIRDDNGRVDDEEEEENDDLDDDDVDDELVPWELKGRFGKQRIRKMGKRSGSKFSKSKKLPHYHQRPGCLYGKHGLGVQHSYI